MGHRPVVDHAGHERRETPASARRGRRRLSRPTRHAPGGARPPWRLAASRIPLGPWDAIDSDELLDHFRVHVTAPIAVTRALTDRGAVGRMIIIDSVAATTPWVGWSAYAIAKATAQMSARAAAQELDGTLVARVFPGAVETPLLRHLLDADHAIPAAVLCQSIEADGRVSDPLDVGRDTARIILDVTDEEFAATETWPVGHSVDPAG